MAAPKGNEFWKLRSKHGRDKLFSSPNLMWDAACEYFQWCDDNPFQKAEQLKQTPKPVKEKDGSYKVISPICNMPVLRPYTIHGLCLYLDCNTMYFNQFEAAIKDKEDDISKAFSLVITRIKETIYNNQLSGASAGFFNANIIARNLGLSDKTENRHDLSDEMKAAMRPFKERKPNEQ